jgi:phytoene dehydrogenase-like protein
LKVTPNPHGHVPVSAAQVWPSPQVLPQSTTSPQLLVTDPQRLPVGPLLQVVATGSGTQVVAAAVQAPAEHDSPSAQASPQSEQSVFVPNAVQAPPQQASPAAQPKTHVLSPPHTRHWSAAQSPQTMVPPQPSSADPHSTPAGHAGVQQVSVPQTWSPVQVETQVLSTQCRH